MDCNDIGAWFFLALFSAYVLGNFGSGLAWYGRVFRVLKRKFGPDPRYSDAPSPMEPDMPVYGTSTLPSEAAALEEGAAVMEPSPPWWEDEAHHRPEASLFELVLRDGPALDRRLLDEQRSPGLVQGLVALATLGLLAQGALLGLAAQFTQHGIPWLEGWAFLTLPLGLNIAFLGAMALCLPSFYFYTQMAGLDAPLPLITAQALRVQARTSVLLIGSLPVYAILALAAVGDFEVGEALAVPVGLALPFLWGLFGLHSLWSSFRRLQEALPRTRTQRAGLIELMVAAWAALFAVISPIALVRAMEGLSTLAHGG